MSDLLNVVCKTCGSKEFEYPADPKDDDQVTCVGCKGVIKYGELNRQIENEMDNFLDDITKNIFR